MTSLNIEPMVPDEEAEDMLDSCCLQVSDLRKEIPLRLFGIRDARGLVGIVGVELQWMRRSSALPCGP